MPFSIDSFKADTKNFHSANAQQRNGLNMGKFNYLAYNVGRTLWRFMYQERLSDKADTVNPLFAVPPPLRADRVKNCRVFSDRIEMISSLNKGLVWAEIGTYEGKFARELSKICQPCELNLFDIDFSLVKEKKYICESDTIHFHQGQSSESMSTFTDGYFDCIYIDADHSMIGVARDVDVAIRKIKNDGLIIFNDYILFSHLELKPYGTVPVVNSLCTDSDWEMVGFALHPKMYCDVMLRKKVY